MKSIKFCGIFVLAVIFTASFIGAIDAQAAVKVAAKAPVAVKAKVTTPVTKKKVAVKKPKKIIYHQGLVTNAPLIDPKHPPGGPR